MGGSLCGHMETRELESLCAENVESGERHTLKVNCTPDAQGVPSHGFQYTTQYVTNASKHHAHHAFPAVFLDSWLSCPSTATRRQALNTPDRVRLDISWACAASLRVQCTN